MELAITPEAADFIGERGGGLYVHISLRRIPRRLRIEWDGERWGQRGRAEATDAGG